MRKQGFLSTFVDNNFRTGKACRIGHPLFDSWTWSAGYKQCMWYFVGATYQIKDNIIPGTIGDCHSYTCLCRITSYTPLGDHTTPTEVAFLCGNKLGQVC